MRGLREFILAALAIVSIGVGYTVADYLMNQGTGTSFGSTIVSSVHYARQHICDQSSPANCVNITGASAMKVDNSAVTQPISAASLPLPTGASTSANQTNKTQLTQLTDGTTAATTYTNYGTAPSGSVPGVNAFMTNAQPLGPFLSASSTSVTIASDTAVADACMFSAKTNLPISQSAPALTQIIAASGSTKIYICSIDVIFTAANTFGLEYGTSSNCGSGTTALIGSTNMASSMSFAANGGFTLGSGQGTVAVTPASQALCLNLGTTGIAAGNLTYVQK